MDSTPIRLPAIVTPTGGTPTSANPATPDRFELAARKAAKAFEASYLAEMLKYSGLNAMPESFGGGAGEEAFSSFLTEEYARLLSERGGIGIAEQVFNVLKQRMQDS